MKTLNQLALSLDPVPDKASTSHGYTRIYDALLTPVRKRAVALLEIGVWEGASLRMWQAYFTNLQAHLVGVDVDLSHFTRRDGDTFEAIQADAADAGQINAIALAHGPFDVVIDDGSHLWQDQRATFAALWGHVKPGGWYVIEDVQTSYWLQPPIVTPPSLVEWAKGLADEVNGRGKTARADIANAASDELAQLAGLELEIASVRFERYMVLIEKREGMLG